MFRHKAADIWTWVSIALLVLFMVFLIFPLFGVLKHSVYDNDDNLSLVQFKKFFGNRYYSSTIGNSFKVTIAVTIVSLLLALPFSYFYTFYNLKGTKFLFVVSILCVMSAPFIGAYAWIMLLGRSGVITRALSSVGINIGSIYGFKGILLVQSLKFFPLVFIYMNGAFRNIDNSLMEASANLGCSGVKRFFQIVMRLSMPTLLAAALMVFMRAFADYGTPGLIGEGYRTFPVEIYSQFMGENGQNQNFAAAISVFAVVVTAVIFLIQKWATNRFKFTMNVMHPIQKKEPHGLSGVLMHGYCYLLVILGFLPNLYIANLSFRNCDGSIFKPGYSLVNYQNALKRLLVRSIENTLLQGFISLAIIIVISILIAFLVVRKGGLISNTLDTMSMLPYIMPGSVIGIALVFAFGPKPWALTGTIWVMILNLVIRRMPYTIRSATARLMQIPLSIDEVARSLGASKLKTLVKITVPLMSSGIISGAILSWVAIITEISGAIILYSNKTINLTVSTYVSVGRGRDGVACAFATIVTALTIISMVLFLAVSKSEDDIKL
ncbi:MAG: iron ABC transporter permease [Synergistaceae bacterium]|nr:iron ABC transporter permease [Synergistaceae bacterium]HQB90906.1 iron ABC transporter permease [Sphaerochaeta sp.]